TDGGEATPPESADDAARRRMAREERFRHYQDFLRFCDGHCGLCIVRALRELEPAPNMTMAHDINRCPSLHGSEERQQFFNFRKRIEYTRTHHLCWTCHISAMAHVHPPFCLHVHPHRRVGLPMAWAIFSDSELRTDAFGDLVLSSPLESSRRHSWDSVEGFASWISDKHATEEPSSVMAIMDFVRRRLL
ncbi:hypothetical protein GGG16DRAFT_67883, partial [Schizophyllum commune]